MSVLNKSFSKKILKSFFFLLQSVCAFLFHRGIKSQGMHYVVFYHCAALTQIGRNNECKNNTMWLEKVSHYQIQKIVLNRTKASH